MKRKIGIVVRSFFSKRIGGLARVSLNLYEILNRDFDVYIITDKKKVKEYSNFQNIKIIELDSFYKELKEIDLNLKFHKYICVSGLLGQILISFFCKNIISKIIPYLFTKKFSFSDLKYIETKKVLRNFRRIFHRPFFFTVFIPNFIIKYTLIKYDVILFASIRLKKIYKLKYNLNMETYCYFPLIKKKRNENNIVKGQSKISIVHSGLASEFRGLNYLIQILKKIDLNKLNKKILLQVFLYIDEDENIYYNNILFFKKRLKNLKNINFQLITNPIKLNELMNKNNIFFFNYSYEGDIPEVPLTVLELVENSETVLINKFMGTYDILGEQYNYLNNNLENDVDILIKNINKPVKSTLNEKIILSWKKTQDILFAKLNI